MSDGTKIEWADASWPVTTGCSRESPGCGTFEGGCYAEKMAWRLSHNPATPQYQGTVHITPTLTLAEFARVCSEWQGGSVRIEMFTDGKVRIGDTFYSVGVNAACANYYNKAVKSLREQAMEAQSKADAIHAVLAKVVTP